MGVGVQGLGLTKNAPSATAAPERQGRFQGQWGAGAVASSCCSNTPRHSLTRPPSRLSGVQGVVAGTLPASIMRSPPSLADGQSACSTLAFQ